MLLLASPVPMDNDSGPFWFNGENPDGWDSKVSRLDYHRLGLQFLTVVAQVSSCASRIFSLEHSFCLPLEHAVCESQRTLEVDKLTYPGVLWDAKDHYFRTAKLISENPKKRFRETISAIFSKEVVFKDTD